MSRVSKEQMELNRIAIEKASSRLFRERGLAGVSVADLMAEAGLTHGGFYGHFTSKDELAAIACTKAFEQSELRWLKRVKDEPDDAAALTAITNAYLSTGNRDFAGTGCPLTSLATDVTREPKGKPVRDAFLTGLNNLIEILVDIQSTEDVTRNRSLALVQLSTMVGAQVLARATQGDKISDELLDAAREELIPDD